MAADVSNLVFKGVLAGRVTSIPASRVLDDLAAIVVIWIVLIIGTMVIQVGLEEGVAAAVTKQPEARRICASCMKSLECLFIIVSAPCTGVVQLATNVLQVSKVCCAGRSNLQIPSWRHTATHQQGASYSPEEA